MQTTEYGDLLLLVKYMAPNDQWVYIIGDESEVAHTGFSDSESDAKAKAIRYAWAVNNMTPERVAALIK